MVSSTPRGFGLRVLEVETDLLDEWLSGLLDELDDPEADFNAVTNLPPTDPSSGAPPPH
jgi:hypothetical protein